MLDLKITFSRVSCVLDRACGSSPASCVNVVNFNHRRSSQTCQLFGYSNHSNIVDLASILHRVTRRWPVVMVESSSHLKRKVPVGARVSPPPVRRKVQSTTTRMLRRKSFPLKTFYDNIHAENAVASFFTRASLKPPEKITWRERAPNDNTPASLLVGKYGFHGERTDSQKNPSKVKIAAFDFVSPINHVRP